MKNLLIFLALVSLCACAGNPPAWWNPSGAYGVQTETTLPQKTTPRATVSAVMTPVEEEPMEQSFEVADDAYEEMRLAPLPETDGTENADETQQQAACEEAEELDLGGKKSPVVSAQTSASKVQDYLPEDGSLPPPSVLEL